MKKNYHGLEIGIIIVALLLILVLLFYNNKSVVGVYYCDRIKMTASIQSDNEMTFSVKGIVVEKNNWQKEKGKILLDASGSNQYPSVGEVFSIKGNYLMLDDRYRFNRLK
jgi:hypothetical protein